VKHSIIAGRYAQALYDEAVAQKILDKVADELTLLDSLCKENRDFNTVINSPALSRDEKLGVIKGICDKAAFSKLVKGFLLVLTSNGRLAALDEVISAVKKRMMAAKGEIEVQVTYAAEVDDSVRKELKAKLAQFTGKSVVLSESVDTSLLGGLKVLIGSRMYDASVKGRLDSLKVQLTR
jgi:F-type H+-transporting ATPase subunit delta